MNRSRKIGLPVLALLAGCAVQGAQFTRIQPPPDNAVVYVYRPYHYANSLLRPPVTCGDETARIGPGAYHAFIVPAGRVVCTVQGSESTDTTGVDAAPRVHYLREEIGWGILSGHPRLEPIDADVSHAEIAACCVQESGQN